MLDQLAVAANPCEHDGAGDLGRIDRLVQGSIDALEFLSDRRESHSAFNFRAGTLRP